MPSGQSKTSAVWCNENDQQISTPTSATPNAQISRAELSETLGGESGVPAAAEDLGAWLGEREQEVEEELGFYEREAAKRRAALEMIARWRKQESL